MDTRPFNDLKERKERLDRDIARATGAVDEILSQLRDRFNCESLEQAETLRVAIVTNSTAVSQQYEVLLKEFEAAWPGEINGQK